MNLKFEVKNCGTSRLDIKIKRRSVISAGIPVSVHVLVLLLYSKPAASPCSSHKHFFRLPLWVTEPATFIQPNVRMLYIKEPFDFGCAILCAVSLSEWDNVVLSSCYQCLCDFQKVLCFSLGSTTEKCICLCWHISGWNENFPHLLIAQTAGELHDVAGLWNQMKCTESVSFFPQEKELIDAAPTIELSVFTQ